MKKIIFSTTASALIVQTISFFSYPFLGRLFGSDNFGLFSYYASLVLVLSAIFSLKGEFLFYQIKKKYENSLIFLSFIISTVLLLFSFLAEYFLDLDINLILISFAVVSTFCFEYYLHYNVSTENFGSNNFHRLIRAILFPSLCFILSLRYPPSYEIIIFSLAFSQISPYFTKAYRQSLLDVKNSARLLIEIFPSVLVNAISMVPSHFLKQLSLSSFVIIMTFLGANSEAVGQFAMAFKFVLAPAMIFSLAASELFRSKAKNDKQKAYDFYKKYLLISSIFFALIAIATYFYSGLIFDLILGDEWSDVSGLFMILLPVLYSTLCLSPFTYVYLILGKPKYDLAWQIYNIISISICLLIACRFDFEYVVLIYSIVYSFNILVSFFTCRNLLLNSEEVR